MADDKVGSASVEISADLGPLESRLKAAEQMVRDFVEKTTPSLTIGGKTTSGEVRIKVKADIELNAAQLQTEIQKAINGKAFKLTLDTAYLTQQIQAALKGAFKINLDGANLNISQAHVAGAPQSGAANAAPTAEVTRAFNATSKQFKDAVADLHDFLKESGQNLSAPSRNPLAQYIELVDRFGAKLEGVAQALGNDPLATPFIKTVTSGAGARGLGTATTEMLAAQVQYARSPAAQQAVQQQARATAAHVGPAIKSAMTEAIKPVTQELAENRKQQQAIVRGAIRATQPVDLGAVPDFDAGLGAARPGRRQGRAGTRAAGTGRFGSGGRASAEDDALRDQALGSSGLRRRGTFNFPGFGQRNIEPLIRAYERGDFNDLIEVVSGKNKGSIRRLTPDASAGTAEQLDQIGMIGQLRRQGGRGRFTLPNAGLGGQVRLLNPRDAFGLALGQSLGGGLNAEQIQSLMETPGLSRMLSQAGSATKIDASGRGAGRIGASPQRYAAAAVRVQRLDKLIDQADAQIEGLYERIESLTGSGKDTTRLEGGLDRAILRRNRMADSRAESAGLAGEGLSAISPAERAALNEQSRLAVAEGRGLTPLEHLARQASDPGAVGRRLAGDIGAGRLPNPQAVISQVQSEMGSPEFMRPIAVGQGFTTPTIAGAVKRRMIELRQELKQGLGDKPSAQTQADFETIMSAVEQALQGDIATRGGFAQEAVDRADAGTGFGRRPRMRPGAAGIQEELGARNSGKAKRRIQRKQLERNAQMNDPIGWHTQQIQMLEGERDRALGVGESVDARGNPIDRPSLLDQLATAKRAADEADPSNVAERRAKQKAIEDQVNAIAGPYNEQIRQLKRQRGRIDPRSVSQRDPLTGDQVQARYADAGGFSLAGAGGPGFAGYNAMGTGGGGAAGGGGGGGGGGGRGRGGGFTPSGGSAVPVYVTNWAEWGGAGAGGGSVTSEGDVAAAVADSVGGGKAAKPIRYNRRGMPILGITGGGGLATSVRPGGVQTFDPEVYARQDAIKEARSLRLREQLFSASERRAAAQEARRAGRAGRGGIIGIPSFERAQQELRGSGVDLNSPDPRAISGLLLEAPSSPVLRARSAARQARGRLPQRALSTSIVQIAENLFGGLNGPLERLSVLQDRTSDVDRLATQQSGLRSARRSILAERRTLRQGISQAEAVGGDTAVSRARLSGLDRQFTDLIKTSKGVDSALKQGIKDVELLGKSAVTGSDVLRNLAAGAVGGIAGGLVAGAVSGVVAAVIPLAQAAVGPAIERATGFTATTARITGGLADAFRAGGGAPGAIAGAAAGTGISAAAFGRISPLVTQRAETEAGNKAIQEQLDLLHTAEQLRTQNQVGLDKGLSSTTGGAFGTSLFGIPSTQELLSNELLPTRTSNAGRVSNPGRQLTADKLAATLGKSAERLQVFNDQIEKGGDSVHKLFAGTDAEVAASAKLAREGGLGALAASLEKNKVAISGASTPQDIQAMLAALNRGGTTPTPELLIQDMQRQLDAQKQVEDQQRRFAIGTQIPAQFGIQQAEQPLGDQTQALKALGVGKADLKEIAGLQSQVQSQALQGIATAKNFVSQTFAGDASVGADFAASLDKAAGYGKQISDLQIGVETEQAAYAAQQYAYQIYQVKRSLADAKGLLSGTGSSLGAIERQIYNLQRESQALSLGQTQKQINFQQAIAGFTAPGLTGEERAARIKEAKIEADYAQKQLDIQKKIFGLSGRQFTIGAQRAVQDLTRQLGLLERGREVTLHTAAAEKKIRILTLLQAKENAKIETYYNAAVARTNDVIELEGKLIAATGAGLAKVTQLAIAAFENHYAAIINAIQGGGGGGGDRGDRPLHTGPTSAGGAIGLTSGITNLGIAGEAGTEAVAIIRNPRPYTGGGGGGGVSVVINITGNTIRDDSDLQKLADKVESRLSRKLALIGARNF